MTTVENRRRSWAILSTHEPSRIEQYSRLDADVLILDLEYSLSPRHRDSARESLERQISAYAKADRNVFVRVDPASRLLDVRAALHPGLNGIVVTGLEHPDAVVELDAICTTLERERGIIPGSTELVLMLESANAFWNVASLAQASSRVTTLCVGRIDLTMGLGPVPQNEFRLYRFLMTRTLLAARMLGKQPLGAFWRPGSRGGVASLDATLQAAHEGRLLGFTGCLCADIDQVAAVNQGFTYS